MDSVRYGIIGIKGVGGKHVSMAQEHQNVELTALVDLDEAVVKAQSQELGVRAFTDYHELLDAGIVDAVSIATPHHLHSIIGLECSERGCAHFYRETACQPCVRCGRDDRNGESARFENLCWTPIPNLSNPSDDEAPD